MYQRNLLQTPNDDTCSVCGDGGELICWDKCPSTYHLSCMNMERVPQNDWFCPYCVCKYCGLVVKKKEKKNGFKCSQYCKKCHWECIEKEFSKETLDLNPSRPYWEQGCRESIVYRCRSNLTRIDFRCFYMFVLEKDDEIFAAASIRFHGKGIAEMPLIAIDTAYRSQGVCQDLMRVIESFLHKLEVKNLIIPSALGTSEMWKRKFNFTELSNELEREISSYIILIFPDSLRLCKDLSASIADDGDDIEDNQSYIKNDLEPQIEQAEANARLEHGPSSGRLEVQEVGIVTDGK